MTRPFLGAIPLLVLLAAGSVDAQVRPGWVDVDGARLYYEETGDGPPLVLIHGGFLDHRMWDGQFERFGEVYRTIRYDVRAHGRSRADSTPFADYEDLRRLMDARSVDRAVVVGLSMGGQIAIDLAVAYPERVSGLVLVGSGLSGFSFDGEETRTYVRELTAAFEAEDFAAVTETFAHWWCDGPHRAPSDVDPVVRRKVLTMLAGSGQRWQYYGLVEPLAPPAVDRLADIRVPVLSIVGALDVSDIHRISDLVVQNVANARQIVIPGVAHMVNMERPEEFERAVLAFLGESATGESDPSFGGRVRP